MKNNIREVYSKEHILYLKKIRFESFKVKIFQILILIFLIFSWEILSYFNLIDSFMLSSPSRIVKTFLSYSNQIWNNILITAFETVVGFISGTILGIAIATFIWWSDFIYKVSQPYLVITNAVPKVALGPIIIIWLGAGKLSIIIMALLVSVVISTINILNGFINVDKNQILLMKSFSASKIQIFTKLILPSNLKNIISSLKINVGMSLIGVITGEFLVSDSGIGYLITYGGQVFNMDLVMLGIIMLIFLAFIMYKGVNKLEIILNNRK